MHSNLNEICEGVPGILILKMFAKNFASTGM